VKVEISNEKKQVTIVDEDALLWMEVVELCLEALRAHYPYLTREMVADYLTEESTNESNA